MQIAWRQATPDEAVASKACIRALLPPEAAPKHEHLLVRLASLPFYPLLVFIEITDLGPEGKWRPPPWAPAALGADAANESTLPSRQLYVLFEPDSDRIALLDTTNQPVYALNQEGFLDLTSETVLAYVSFFFSTVSGPYGLMPVLETLNIAADAEIDDETAAALAALRDYLPPHNRLVAADDGFNVQVCLLFQGSIFKASIHVDLNGTINIKEHALALSGGGGADNSDAGRSA